MQAFSTMQNPSLEVSGTFDGSPIILDYQFIIENAKIR